MNVAKTCATCGREVKWRKKWSDCWEDVRFCSERCRHEKPRKIDDSLEKSILDLLGERARGKTICPGEAARQHFNDDSWRDEMERTRRAARRLVAKGTVEMLQQGNVVDPSTAKGPIRLRLTHRP